MFAAATGRRPHLHLFGIPVRVEPFFVLIILFLGLGLYEGALLASWFAIASISVLVHELGHAAAFKAFGASPSIVLHGLGGLTSAQADLSPPRSIVVSLAGPLATLVPFGIPAMALAMSGSVTGDVGQTILNQVLFVNVVWAVLNLMPVLPLDGGNVMAALIDWVKPGRGRRAANVVSLVLSGALGVWGLVSGFVFVGVIARVFVAMNAVELARSGDAPAERDGLVAQAYGALARNEPFAAEQLAREALAGRASPGHRALASELVAWARLAAGDPRGAQEAITRMAPGEQPSVPYQGAWALTQGDGPQGVALLAWSLVNQTEEPMLRFGLAAAVRAGVIGELAHELVQLGEPGRSAASQLAGHLTHSGCLSEASMVNDMLVAFDPTP